MHKTHASDRRPSSYLRAQLDLASMATRLPRSCQRELHEYGIKPPARLVSLSSAGSQQAVIDSACAVWEVRGCTGFSCVADFRSDLLCKDCVCVCVSFFLSWANSRRAGVKLNQSLWYSGVITGSAERSRHGCDWCLSSPASEDLKCDKKLLFFIQSWHSRSCCATLPLFVFCSNYSMRRITAFAAAAANYFILASGV